MVALFRGIPASMDDFTSNQRPVSPSDSGQSSGSASGGDSPGCSDSFNETLRYISEMLMEEEDLERNSVVLKDSLALQAAERSLYEVISQNHPSSSSSSSSGESRCSSSLNTVVRDSVCEAVSLSRFRVRSGEESSSTFSQAKLAIIQSDKVGSNFHDEVRGKRNHRRESGFDDREEGRSHKQSAVFSDSSAPIEMFDRVLLYENDNDELNSIRKSAQRLQIGDKHGKKSGSRARKQHSVGMNNYSKSSEIVDLWTLMTQCTQAVASHDQRTAIDIIQQIRQHSSPEGDSTERLAHYFTNGLEARLMGSRMASYSPVWGSEAYSTGEILRAHQVYITACPFLRMSYCFANKMISKLARKAATIHVVDFGILYGFQWPGLIQRLSKMSGGPLRLRITGIEFPQPGFRPRERVEETMRRLADYCERFSVPWEFNMISKKWETIRYEELGLRNDEVVVVNCLYRMKHIPDETVVADNPRDTVLKLIRRINPSLFVHGVCNGTYNAPFFVTRFREALFHYSGLFDMFDTTVPRDDLYRMKFEKAIYGRDIVNVIACEGAGRVERPETYKQWQVRNTRAGFRQIPLNAELFESVKQTVDSSYNKDFVVEQHGQWLVQGWKGRRIYAVSCWKPA